MLSTYTAAEWLLFFYIYCFIGWCIETTYVSVNTGKFVNRGFIRGPFLPLYGSGAITILFATIPFRTNLLFIFLSGGLAATILEYITGVFMELLFKVRYWDYSDKPFQFQGHICLSSSIAWGLLSIALVKLIHQPIENLVLSMNPTFLLIIVIILSLFIVTDFILSFKTAIDIRFMLEKMEKAKSDLAHLHTRIETIYTDFKPELEDELVTLRNQYTRRKDKQLAQLRQLNFYRRHLLKSHPTAISLHFRETFEELKKSVFKK